MSDRLAALRLFARVARRGSFSAASRELGVPQSTVSRTIAELERDMGILLLARTTRAVTLTDAGADFLARLEPILADLEDAEQIARGADELRGTLRVALGSSLGAREVIPRLPMFIDQHPALYIELELADQRQDLLTEGIDVALRFGPLPNSTATARRVRAWPKVLTASPAYLARVGTPRTPADLSGHAVILGPVSSSPNWTFRRGGTATSIRVDGRIRITGNEGAIAAAVAALGIVMTTSGAVRREIERGELVRILDDWDLGAYELNAIFVSGRGAKSSARALVAFLVDALRDIWTPSVIGRLGQVRS